MPATGLAWWNVQITLDAVSEPLLQHPKAVEITPQLLSARRGVERAAKRGEDMSARCSRLLCCVCPRHFAYP